LGLRFYFAFGTEGEIGIGSGVGTAQEGLDALLFTIRKCQVAKVEAEGASATEAAGGFTSSHDTCQGGTLGDGNGAIRIVDRFVNSGLNGLSGRRDSRVQFFVEVRLNDPGRRGIADRGCDGREAWIWRGKLGEGDGSRRLYGPRGAFRNALRMIGQVTVEDLDKTVLLVWAGEGGYLVADGLLSVVELLVNESAFAWRKRHDTDDGPAVDGVARSERKQAPLQELNMREADDRSAERREVDMKAGVDTAGAVGLKFDDAAENGRLGGKEKSVAGIYGIECVRTNRRAYAHRKSLVDLDGKRGARRKYPGSGFDRRFIDLASALGMAEQREKDEREK